MKTWKTLALSLLVAVTAKSQMAAADQVAGPLWSCQIEADLQGFEVGVFIAVKSLEGEGKMKCKSVTGDVHKTFPIYMEIKGAGLGFGYSEPKNLKFLTGDIGVTNPHYLYGRYGGGLSADGTLVDMGGTVGLGVSFSKRGAAVRGVLAGGDAEGLLGAITGSIVQITPL